MSLETSSSNGILSTTQGGVGGGHLAPSWVLPPWLSQFSAGVNVLLQRMVTRAQG